MNNGKDKILPNTCKQRHTDTNTIPKVFSVENIFLNCIIRYCDIADYHRLKRVCKAFNSILTPDNLKYIYLTELDVLHNSVFWMYRIPFGVLSQWLNVRSGHIIKIVFHTKYHIKLTFQTYNAELDFTKRENANFIVKIIQNQWNLLHLILADDLEFPNLLHFEDTVYPSKLLNIIQKYCSQLEYIKSNIGFMTRLIFGMNIQFPVLKHVGNLFLQRCDNKIILDGQLNQLAQNCPKLESIGNLTLETGVSSGFTISGKALNLDPETEIIKKISNIVREKLFQ